VHKGYTSAHVIPFRAVDSADSPWRVDGVAAAHCCCCALCPRDYVCVNSLRFQLLLVLLLLAGFPPRRLLV
jgi:hypothetical protein